MALLPLVFKVLTNQLPLDVPDDTKGIPLTVGMGGPSGPPGATFIPHLNTDGTLSWTNDAGLPNPDPVSIMGPVGPAGGPGPQGPKGPAGDNNFFIVSLDADGKPTHSAAEIIVAAEEGKIPVFYVHDPSGGYFMTEWIAVGGGSSVVFTCFVNVPPSDGGLPTCLFEESAVITTKDEEVQFYRLTVGGGNIIQDELQYGLPYYGVENAGKLLCVGADGYAKVLALGAGLAIIDGVLILTSQVIASAICGQAVCGNVICGGA